MTEFVEFVSMGNVMAMLLFTAFVCLVLGMGVSTTANYILVATLMARSSWSSARSPAS